MMNLNTIMPLALALLCCSAATYAQEQAQPGIATASGNGYFDGVIGDHAYLVNVNCFDLQQEYFRFLSDRTDSADSNGDGVIISGMQNGQKFVLTVIDNGKTSSTGRLETFKKNQHGATGSGTLYQDNSTADIDSHFIVVCDR